MINDKRICAVMPAYNAERTLARTTAEIDRNVVDDVIVVDDHSKDATRELAQRLGLHYAFHARNYGYGGNQKTCYALALELGADIVVMLHPDYQYDPRLLPSLAYLVASGAYDVGIASRILGKGALRGGMPMYKYLANRTLTLAQNVLTGQKLSEYHTGYRAFSRKVLETLPLEANSDDFIFDNQMLVQSHRWGFRIGEISCPTRYFPEASSINFARSTKYGMGVLGVSLGYRASMLGLYRPPYLDKDGPDDGRLTLHSARKRIAGCNIIDA
jgi:glycosyltransferase involved in cell wall biosynthesis